jgi:hypothetical protein
MRVLFNTVPVATVGADITSVWGESRTLNGSLTDLVSVHRQSGNNTGNFIHWEAPSRIIDFDADKSRAMRLWTTITQTKDKDGLRRHIQENFDAIVISEANFIQKNTNLGIVAEFLSTLEGVAFFLFGAGIQDAPPESFHDVSPGTANFLKLMNERAALFATRGPQTTGALNGLGLTNSKPIGCPSLFAYPKSMMDIRKPINVSRICAAGHLTRKALEIDDIRARKIVELAQHVDMAYVFQTETFGFTGAKSSDGKMIVPNLDHGIFSMTTSSFDQRYMSAYLKAVSGSDINIREYLYFANCDSWRTKMKEFDVYIGDRFHGGVACMQVGVPTIFLKNDARVDELTAAISAPSIRVADFEPSAFRDVIEEAFSSERLDDYYGRYREAHRIFVDTLRDSGLVTKNDL